MDFQMNKAMIAIGLVLCAQTLSAQTFKEWFHQKKTQKEYLIQQIAALKVYLTSLKKGYDIVQKGLNTVGDIKQGKFDLDIEYLESLKNVNSAVSGSAKVANIVGYQKAIMLEFRKLKDLANESELLTAQEKRYVADVYSNMLKESEVSLEELDRVLSDTDFEMKDDERINRIDLLYVDMKDKYSFTKSFSSSTRQLISQRAKDEHEILVQENFVLK
jgi:hypothetical protein